jgi:hypothetical protein
MRPCVGASPAMLLAVLYVLFLRGTQVVSVPTPDPTHSPSIVATPDPGTEPTPAPSRSLSPTLVPTRNPTHFPTPSPTHAPTPSPTFSVKPSAHPTDSPTMVPTKPTPAPSMNPTDSFAPTFSPTKPPTLVLCFYAIIFFLFALRAHSVKLMSSETWHAHTHASCAFRYFLSCTTPQGHEQENDSRFLNFKPRMRVQ